MKRTVLELLNSAAERFPDTNYVNEKTDNGWVGKTYPEVNKEADYMAHGLLELGVGLYDKVSLISEGRVSWIISEFGVLKAGAIVVPLSIKLLPEEIAFRVNHSESKVIIVSSNISEKVIAAWPLFENKDIKIIYLDENKEQLQKHCDKHGVSVMDRVTTYAELIAKGKELETEKSEVLKQVVDGIEESDVVTISYTSGTTGNPKGIMLTQLNYHENSLDAVEHFQIEQGISTLIILPLDHSFAHTVGIYTSCVRGLQMYFVDSRGSSMAALKNIPINLKEVNPDFLLTVPALTGNFMAKMQEGIAAKGGIVEKIFKAGINAGMKRNKDGFRKAGFFERLWLWPAYALANSLIFPKLREVFGKNLKYCVGGGALLDVKQQHFYYALGIPIFQGYGLSEATPIISANTPAVHKMGSSGKVLSTIDCKIMDDKGNEMPTGKKGEIVIKGLNVMKGYFKNEEATTETVKGEWLHTGDLGYYDEDDFLIVTGREKALLISQDGEKYSPEGIEEAIQNCSKLINQVMLYNDHSKYTTCVVTLNNSLVEKELKQNGTQNAEDVIKLINKELHTFKHEPEYKGQFLEKWIPNTFTILEESFTEQNFMINSTLKMVRYKITETYKPKIDFMYTTEGSNNVNEENLKAVKNLFNV